MTRQDRQSGSGQAATTTMSYDEAGQIVSATDACGNGSCIDVAGANHTTSYSYSPSYYDAYLTGVAFPPANGVFLQKHYTYALADGKMTGSEDENSNWTYYQYNQPPPGCADGLDRLGEVNYSAGDEGTITYCYNDAAPSPSVTTTKVMSQTPSINLVKSSVMDGFGHVVQTRVVSDPSGVDCVDTTYDGNGLVYSVSNPHRSCTSKISQVVTYTYDSLGRTIKELEADLTSTRQWCYSDIVSSPAVSNCSSRLGSISSGSWVDFTDEVGNHTQRVSDSFGRLTEVMEPNPAGTGTGLETDYTYNALNDLMAVNQKGTSPEVPRTRTFTYDALSRLVCASNPETTNAAQGQGTCPHSATAAMPAGVISYSYDANGNVSSKTDVRGITTVYTYDPLNRLLSKSYLNDSLGTATSCFQYDTSSIAGAGGNLLGRLTNEWTQKMVSGGCASSPSVSSAAVLSLRAMLSFDSMGRLLSEQQCTKANCAAGTSYNPIYSYDLTGNMFHHSNGIGTITFSNCYNQADQLLLVVSVSLSTCSSSYPPNAAMFTSPLYTPAGSLSSAIYGVGLGVTRSYDSRLRITGETDTGNSPTNPTPGTAMITINGTDSTH